MPIYEYRCGSCDHQLEVMQKLADDPLKDCPECKQPALKKLISAVGFRLKGSGWYETDFKTGEKKKNLATSDDKPAEKKAETGPKSESSKSESSASSKSESKSTNKSSDSKAA